MTAMRPIVTGNRYVVSSGHQLASAAAARILDEGGNAIDAGVAAVLALTVVQSDLVSLGGVAPLQIYSAQDGRISTVAGLGTWPAAIPPNYFHDQHGGRIPRGVLRAVVPAAPDALIRSLARWGTRSFSDVAAAAIEIARDGFAVHQLFERIISEHEREYREHAENASIYLPGGRVPAVGEQFYQRDLAKALHYMIDEEGKAKIGGRLTGLEAARRAFYSGDIGKAIVQHHQARGGFLAANDLESYEAEIGEPRSVNFDGHCVYSCDAWCQGPALLQILSLLDPTELRAVGHNSSAYIHLIVEATKLAFADRDAFYGDPRHIDVPLDVLLAPDYAIERRAMIDRERAAEGMPPPGMARNYRRQPPAANWSPPEPDTSYVCVIDSDGNAFSATPSDASFHGEVINGFGFVSSLRGSQSWADPSHPSCVAAGKRPRLTPSPALARLKDGSLLAFGTPGGDVQIQAMLQVFLNMCLFEMDEQAAIEAPRVASYSFPSSFEPHDYHPGRLNLEGRIESGTAAELERLGHRVDRWPDWTWLAGGICLSRRRPDGRLTAGADPRRSCYAYGF